MSGLGIDGLVSGLDTSGIITELLKLRQKPIDGVKARIEKTQDRADALKELNTGALALQEVVKRLRLPSGFTRAQAVSSNPALLRATGDIATQLGTFSFVGKQVAAASQFVSQGFPDPDRATVAPQGGHVTIELGDARLSRPVDLAAIHGGAGFARGKIRIVDDGGRSAIVDLTAAVTL
ncbi:MAG TPA: flagellar cap protein FliD N-terminal domain-containing protein, partial [Planctomycetota bacterium]|nr:flagellar cap protein FliD N-terminal domain-containing protein [Planctomycetota bacterium]